MQLLMSKINSNLFAIINRIVAASVTNNPGSSKLYPILPLMTPSLKPAILAIAVEKYSLEASLKVDSQPTL